MEILTKKEILDSAEETFRRFGPKKTSVTDIAKVLNISHGTIYRHYPSKKALQEAVTERWLNEKIILPLSEMVNVTSKSKVEALKNYLLKLSSLKQYYAQQDSEMFEMYAMVTAESGDLIKQHVSHMIHHLTTMIQSGIEEQSLKKIDHADKMAEALLHAASRFHHPAHAYEWKTSAIANEFEQVWNVIKIGIAKE